jgi:NAD+ kinase
MMGIMSMPGEFGVGVVVHPTRPVDASVRSIVAWAQARGARCLGREADADRLGPGVTLLPDEEFLEQVHGIVSLGGDGTMLGAMRLVAGRTVPVLGVNYGHLGFLVEVDPSGLEAALTRLAAGEFTIELHPGLVTSVGPGGESLVAFNDVVLTRPATTGSVQVDLAVNGARYGYYRADAVVIATPTGSTAYNYAAGGPVLSPSAPVSVITPVAPMAGIGRPVVLSSAEEIALTPAADVGAAELQIDGVPSGCVEPGQVLTARVLPEAAQVVRLDAERHARRNRVVLSLLDLPLRPDQLLELVPAELRPRLPG